MKRVLSYVLVFAALIVQIAIGHDRIHAGLADHRGKVVRRHVRRADDEAMRNPVQLDQRQGRRKLIPSGDEDRPARQFPEPAAQARAETEVAQRNARVRAPQKAARRVGGATQRVSTCPHVISQHPDRT